MDYYLMHKDIKVILLDFNKKVKILNEAHIPLGIKSNFNQTKSWIKAFNQWWQDRGIQHTRQNILEALKIIGLPTLSTIKLAAKGLSLNDHYWIKEVNEQISYSQVNYYENEYSRDLGDVLFLINKENINYYSPDANTDGWLCKRWIKEENKNILLKCGSTEHDLEALNEVFAYKLASLLGIHCIPYTVREYQGHTVSVCENFTTLNTELIPTYDVIGFYKKSNNESYYDYLLNTCSKLGMPNLEKSLSDMAILDYLIRNEDRHYSNFGFLRNPNTLQWLGLAPIFDNGTSMYYQMNRNISTRRVPFASSLEKQLIRLNCKELSKNLNFNCLDKINQSFDEVYANIPQQRKKTLKILFNLRFNNLTNWILIDNYKLANDNNIWHSLTTQ